MKEYTVQELMVKWNCSRTNVMRKIKKYNLPVEKREVVIEKRQVLDFITLGE